MKHAIDDQWKSTARSEQSNKEKSNKISYQPGQVPKEETGEETGKKSRKQDVRKPETSRRDHERIFSKPVLVLSIIAALLLILNQVQIGIVTGMISNQAMKKPYGEKNLKQLDLSGLKSTAHTVAAVFPVENIKTGEDAMAMMFPTGKPDYGDALDVSFDDPLASLSKLSKMYPGLKVEVQKSNPEAWKRFMNMASMPVGMSCEYCCGVGPIGIDANGNSKCGCQHNPALLSVGLYLTAYTDYSDGEILREVMRWKTLFFPKKMVELATSVSGGDPSALNNLPGMVGGC